MKTEHFLMKVRRILMMSNMGLRRYRRAVAWVLGAGSILRRCPSQGPDRQVGSGVSSLTVREVIPD